MAERVNEGGQSRSSIAWFVAAALPFLVLAAWHWRLGPLAAFGDWSQYMLHGDALYRGKSYVDIGYIFTNLNPYIGPRAQPPGLPATLAVVMAITGGTRDPTIYKLLMVAFSLAFLACTFVYFRRHSGTLVAVAVVTITGLWLETGFVTNAVQPDVGFCAFLWATFWIADRSSSAWRASHVLGITLLGVAALAYRVAALPIVPALAAYALLNRRDVGWRPLIPVVVWCACGLAAAIAVPGALTFASFIEPARVVQNITESARVYPFAALDLYLYPFPWNRANDAYHFALALLAVVGAADWVRREHRRLLTAFAVFYVGMLLVLPMQDGRYLMPLAPLLLYSTVRGGLIMMQWLATRMGRGALASRSERVVLITAVAICALTIVTQIRRPTPPVLLDVPGVRSIFGLLRTEHDRSPVRALFVNPRVLTWETGIPAMGFFLASPDSTLAELRAQRITHVVVGDVGTDGMRARSVARAVTEHQDAFRAVFAEGVFTVLRFDSTRLAPR
jgi:hypothetical protein